MKLYYPLKPIFITQGFGENQNAFYKQQGMKGHSGLDMRAYHGQSIYAAHDGICYPRVDSHGGNGVRLEGTDCSTIYWHLIDDNAVVQTKDKVKAGDLLGYADNTGQSTGTHLHFALRLLDTPLNNGYGGYIDPQPYFNGLYAEDIGKPVTSPKFVFTRTLKLGSWNNEVLEMQKLLNRVQKAGLVEDGIFGVKTGFQVNAFQLAHNLVGDKIVGAKTRQALNSLL